MEQPTNEAPQWLLDMFAEQAQRLRAFTEAQGA